MIRHTAYAKRRLNDAAAPRLGSASGAGICWWSYDPASGALTPGPGSRGRVCHCGLRADTHLNALNSSYDRMCI